MYTHTNAVLWLQLYLPLSGKSHILYPDCWGNILLALVEYPAGKGRVDIALVKDIFPALT